MTMPSEATRAWLYRVGLGVISLLLLYGIIGESEAAEWALFLAVVLGGGGTGLAVANTTTMAGGDDE